MTDTNTGAARPSRNTLVTLGIAGVCGPLIMFAGDMLLYYRDVSSEYFTAHIAEIMSENPFLRLTLGGLAGPVGAVFYACGFALAALLIDPRHSFSRIGIFALFAFLIVIGGAYHAQFPQMAFHADAVLSGALPPSPIFHGVAEAPASYLVVFLYSYLGLGLIAWLWLGVLILLGRTALPRWSVILTPYIWFWFSDFMGALPQPFNIIVAGGWYNICYLPFLTFITLVAARRT